MATDVTRKRMTNSAVAVARRVDEIADKVEKIEAKVNGVLTPEEHQTIRSRIVRSKMIVLEYQGVMRREIVRDFDKTGVWTKPADMRHNPSLHECNFWKWSEIHECLRSSL